MHEAIIAEAVHDPKFLARFWGNVRKTRGCWTWTASRIGNGRAMYGGINVRSGKNHTIAAHRVSWTIANGRIPDGLFVLHRCDNPPCVNPRHLFVGTAGDNMRDMITKGRGYSPRGEDQKAAKLCARHVRKIRALAATGVSLSVMSARFGICVSVVQRVVTGKGWKHVK